MNRSQKTGVIILGVAVAFLLVIHGIARIYLGIALVHFQGGWFVVGAGRGGMEYSDLLITALVEIALLHRPDPLEARPRENQTQRP